MVLVGGSELLIRASNERYDDEDLMDDASVLVAW